MSKLKALFSDRRLLIVFCLGFSSGLPLLLTGGTLQAWFKESGMSLSSIGLLALVGTPYTLKFLWSPIMDWIVPPFLGRRRGWMILAQAGLVIALAMLGLGNPAVSPMYIAILALIVSFVSATQDIAVDAYQIELLPREMYGLGNQFYILGYRIGMLLAGSGALILADQIPWRATYFVMAACMSVGLITTLLAPEPQTEHKPPRSLIDAVWQPLKDFFSASGSQGGKALWILAFILLYKIGGDMATALTTPLYLELGYTKTQIGSVAKSIGLGATIFGGLIGGGAVVYLGTRRSLWVFGILQGVANLAFAWLHYYVTTTGTPSVVALATAISVENIAAGLGTAAYTTFMGSLVNRRFTATQYALLSSLMGMTRVFGATPTGWLVERMGWFTFFVFTAFAAIPGLLVLLKLGDVGKPTKPTDIVDAGDEVELDRTKGRDAPRKAGAV